MRLGKWSRSKRRGEERRPHSSLKLAMILERITQVGGKRMFRSQPSRCSQRIVRYQMLTAAGSDVTLWGRAIEVGLQSGDSDQTNT